jgi:hypothetical protein
VGHTIPARFGFGHVLCRNVRGFEQREIPALEGRDRIRGTTHASVVPTFPTTPGATVADGSVVWTCRRAFVDARSFFRSGYTQFEPEQPHATHARRSHLAGVNRIERAGRGVTVTTSPCVARLWQPR